MDSTKFLYIFLGIYFFVYFLINQSFLTINSSNNIVNQYYIGAQQTIQNNSNILSNIFSIFSFMWNFLFGLLFLPIQIIQFMAAGTIDPIVGSILLILTIPGMIALWQVIYNLIVWFIFGIVGLINKVL